jgi:hydrogenase/urease accessory protein HupE
MLVPVPAQAHLVSTGLGPFYDGISHLALTPEDLLPALALALLAGLRGPRSSRLVLLLLPGMWLLGGLAGLAWPAVTESTILTTAALLCLGGMVAADMPVPAGGVAALATVLGLGLGYMNGSAYVAARLGGTGLAGTVSAVAVLVTLVAAWVVALRPPWTRIAVRVAGSWLVAIGLLLLGWALREALVAPSMG